MYATDKWLLLKFSKRPPMYDHKLNAFFLQTAPYAAWAHLLAGEVAEVLRRRDEASEREKG